jgi:prephenate dehydrogenase
MKPIFSRMALIGVGLIGGSLALVAKEKGLVGEAVGFGRRKENLERAKALGAIDRAESELSSLLDRADLVVLATPVGTFEPLIKKMVPFLPEGCVITDVGSVKGKMVERLERLTPKGRFFVGAHPIAGKEKSGIEAASPRLFVGARCILTPTERTDRSALERVRALWEGAGSNIVEMDPGLHDRLLASVSHLPHILAYALMDALTRPPLAKEGLLEFSAGGLRDFTRIAASSEEMWRDIALLNREEILTAVDAYGEALDRIRKMIAEGDGEGLLKTFQKARATREDLGQKDRKGVR